MSKHTYGTYWLYDQANALLLKYLKRQISVNDFTSQFIDLKSKASLMEVNNIADAWHQGYSDAEDKTRLIKASKVDDYFEKYKHNYE